MRPHFPSAEPRTVFETGRWFLCCRLWWQWCVYQFLTPVLLACCLHDHAVLMATGKKMCVLVLSLTKCNSKVSVVLAVLLVYGWGRWCLVQTGIFCDMGNDIGCKRHRCEILQDCYQVTGCQPHPVHAPSSSTHGLTTVPTFTLFTLTIYHSLDFSLQT